MLTFQYTFEPAEEEFNLPAEAKDEGNEFGRKLQEIGHDQQSIVPLTGAEGFFTGDAGRTATGDGIEVVDFNHPARSGEIVKKGDVRTERA